MTAGDFQNFDGLNINDWTPFSRKSIPDKIVINDNCFSILTYNILNDSFLLRGGYDYIPKHFHSSQTRNEFILKEIATLCPDLVCLQEVKRCLYGSQLLPFLNNIGYNGILSVENPDSIDLNVALFYKRDKFNLKTFDSYPFGDLIKSEIIQDGTIETEVILASPHYLRSKCSCLFTSLELRSSECCVTIGVVHLPWSFYSGYDVHCLQIEACVRHLLKMSKGNSFILAGDFNSRPIDVPYYYLERGQLDEKLIQDNIDQKIQFKVLKPFLNSCIQLKSCYKTLQGHEPTFTTSSEDADGLFSDCLDYIWWWSPSFNSTNETTQQSTSQLQTQDKANLFLRSVLQLPAQEDIFRYHSLPSSLFPSDHLPLQAYFEIV